MKSRLRRKTLVVIAFTLVSCSSQVVPASTPTSEAIVLEVYATSTTMPLLTDLSRQYNQEHPEVTFSLATRSYPQIIDSLMPDAYFLTNHLPVESALWGAPLGQDALVLITGPDTGVESLNTTQMRRIFRGMIRNWGEVGGADQPITVFSREDGAATRAEFERLVMGSRPTTSAARLVPSNRAMLDSVNRTPGAIGYISYGLLDDSAHALQIDGVAPTRDNLVASLYPLRTILYIAGLQEPTGHMRAFIGWAQSPEGQAIVGQHYVPLQP